jgi:hypothetical protein
MKKIILACLAALPLIALSANVSASDKASKADSAPMKQDAEVAKKAAVKSKEQALINTVTVPSASILTNGLNPTDAAAGVSVDAASAPATLNPITIEPPSTAVLFKKPRLFIAIVFVVFMISPP